MQIPECKDIVLLADVSIQSNLLKESLESSLNVNVNVIPFSDLRDVSEGDEFTLKLKERHNLVMVDYSSLSDSDFQLYNQLKASIELPIQEVLINCPTNTPFKSLVRWRELVGVFYLQDDIKSLVKGMVKILDGEMWLSRSLSQEYIRYYRSNSHNAVGDSLTYQNLTRREKQIIQLLGHGASNLQIADKLFVSENTVKTHLHNIFKKINAKNRLQALLWANSNINMEELG